jgi:hypothetical protein
MEDKHVNVRGTQKLIKTTILDISFSPQHTESSTKIPHSPISTNRTPQAFWIKNFGFDSSKRGKGDFCQRASQHVFVLTS